MSLNPDIRLASGTDVPALLEQMQPFNAGERIPWKPERTDRALRHLLAHPELGFVMVAVDGERLLGYTILTFNYDLEWGGRDAFITELWVVAETRGRGLGQRLLQAAEEHARAQDAHALHLAVRPENEARRLYERQGFEAVPRLWLTKPLD